MSITHRRVAGILLLGLLVGAGTWLSAHLDVVRTLPVHESTVTQAPDRVQVWFSQQPSPRVSLLGLRGPGGDVPLGDLVLNRDDRSIAAPIEEPLTPGAYEASWRTAGDDGHVMRGTFRFVLKAE